MKCKGNLSLIIRENKEFVEINKAIRADNKDLMTEVKNLKKILNENKKEFSEIVGTFYMVFFIKYLTAYSFNQKQDEYINYKESSNNSIDELKREISSFSTFKKKEEDKNKDLQALKMQNEQMVYFTFSFQL